MYEIFEKLLEEHGVTAYRVAKDTGIGTATLTNWKNGKYTPKQDKMQKIADYFDVSIDYLMTGRKHGSGEVTITKNYAKNKTEDKLLLLCRSTENISDEEKKDIVDMFESTIDFYLKAKGIKHD
ncbi:MAG: helix-turn-helix transcriptional regulator [Anaerovoracaceae bacterium]